MLPEPTGRRNQKFAVIRALELRGSLDGKHENTIETSEQGQFVSKIYGRPFYNNSLTGALATLHTYGIVKTIGTTWYLTTEYKEAWLKYQLENKKVEDETIKALLTHVVGSTEDRKKDAEELQKIGEQSDPKLKKTKDKREAGCRSRSLAAHGQRARFTNEIEATAIQVCHYVPVCTCSNVADNSIYNTAPYRNDIHAMMDTRKPDGTYAVEVHPHGDVGLILVVNSEDPKYRILDGLVELISDAHMRTEIQKRVIMGNMVRKIEQEVPEWFKTWSKNVLDNAPKRRRKKKEQISANTMPSQPLF